MTAKRVYDVVAVIGERSDGKGGKKPDFLNCGVILEIDGKMKLKMNCYPVNSEGWFQLYTPKPRQERQESGSHRSESDFKDDDINW